MNDVFLLLFAAPAFGVLMLGFFLGLKHATEADHLAAVSTIVAERRSLWSSAFVGGLWGLGHTISLLVAGILVLLLNFQISERTERILEFCVGIMLTLLGLNVLRRLISGGSLHFHSHGHGEHEHVHPHIHDPDHVHGSEELPTHHGFTFSPRALIVGMIHGMAGSAALMLLVIPTIESRAVGLLYVAIFGVGSIAGMSIMTFLVGLPFHFTAARFTRFFRVLQAVSGLIGIFIGLWIMYEKGFSEGLLS